MKKIVKNLLLLLAIGITTLGVFMSFSGNSQDGTTSVSSMNSDSTPVNPISVANGTVISLPAEELATISSVKITKGGFGSDICADPKNPNRFYTVTDRGPNYHYDGTVGEGKAFPVLDYNPCITLFELQSNGKDIKAVKTISLKDPNGNNINGFPNADGYGSSGEIAYRSDGTVIDISTNKYGLDPEGLVAMTDGTFWISDEYGPHLVHFDADGNEFERISPYGINKSNARHIPAVFGRKRSNRGLEGLTITPDEKWLVAITQSTLNNPTEDDIETKTMVRILFFNIADGRTKQYMYKQDSKKRHTNAIVALTNDTFLVLERCKKPGTDEDASKKIYKIKTSGATDISIDDPTEPDGYKFEDEIIETIKDDDFDSKATGSVPVTKTLVIDLLAGNTYPHDKVEGVWLRADKQQLAIINDDDFGITDDGNNGITTKYWEDGTTVDSTKMYFFDINLE